MSVCLQQRSSARACTHPGGSGPFSRGQLYGILRCPIYVGEIPHKGQTFKGLHQPIITKDIWERTQALLTGNCQGHRSGARATSPSLLAGKVFDAGGAALTSSHATKGKVRYRYYVGGGEHPIRVPARELEQVALRQVAALFADPLSLVPALSLAATDLPQLHRRCRELAAEGQARALLPALVERVTIASDSMATAISSAALASLLGLAPDPQASPIILTAQVRLTRTGRAIRLIDGGGGAAAGAAQDASLVKLIAKARTWWRMLEDGELDIKRLASQEGVTASYMTRVVRLAFLSPRVTEAAVAGKLRGGVDAARLLAPGAISAAWGEQERELLPAPK
jgi:site-specific DNA recombinase